MRLFGSAMIAATGPAATTCPPRTPGPGAEIDDVVGRPHRVLVVLDDDHRVALVAELGQGLQQPVVVAGVQADRGLVEDVEHADQAAADLPGQADPLHLAAGERRGGAVEREVVQAHVLEEPQPAADLLEGLGGDRLAGGVEFQRAEELLGVGDGQGADLGQRALGLVARTAATALVSVTARACGLSRWPPQRSQPTTRMYFSSWRRCGRLRVVRYCESSLGMMPSNLPPHL